MSPSDPRPSALSVLRLLRATRYSLEGLRYAWHHEAAFRLEVFCLPFVLALAWWMKRDALEFILLILPLSLTLVIEILNSAIEAAIDRMGSEQHILSKAAKDLGSAAVLLVLCFGALAWGVVLWERVFG